MAHSYTVPMEKPNIWLQELLDTMVARFERLENKGFIAPYFLDKMKKDPNEVLKFLRQNRQVVSDQLERRLDDKQRPTKKQLINRGIVAPGYFEYGHVSQYSISIFMYTYSKTFFKT